MNGVPHRRSQRIGSRYLLVASALAVSVGCAPPSEDALTSADGESERRLLVNISMPAADPAANESDGIVRVSVQSQQTELSSGQRVDVPIRVSIAPGHHVYGVLEQTSPFESLTLTAMSDTDAIRPGQAIPPQTSYEADGKPAYVESLILRQPIQISAPVVPGKHKLELTLAYQACNDLACFPPQRFSFQLDVEIVSASNLPRVNQIGT